MNNVFLEVKSHNSNIFKVKTSLNDIKPIFYNKNNEFELKDIIKIMNIENENYKNEFKNKYIKLNEEQCQKRYDIIIVIKKFIIENSINANIFYYIIHLFDLLIIKNNKHKLISSIEKIGLGALFISLKFFHGNRNSISNKKYKSLYNNRYFSMQEIAKIEFLCLKLIHYHLIRPNPIKYIEFFIINGVLYDSDLNANNKNNTNYQETFNHLYCLIFKNLDLIMSFSNEYIKYNPFYLSGFIIGFSRNILNMEKFPKQFTAFYDFTKINFNDIYNELISKFKNILSGVGFERCDKKVNCLNTIYIGNDIKELENQSLQHIKKNLNLFYNFELINNQTEQNLSSRKYNNTYYMNPFYNCKVSLKYKNIKKYKSNDVKKVENNNNNNNVQASNHAYHSKKSTIFQNCTSKVKNIYKFNPLLFETFANSSCNNIYKNKIQLVKAKASQMLKKQNDKKIIINKCSLLNKIKNNEIKNSENPPEKINIDNISKINTTDSSSNASTNLLSNKLGNKLVLENNNFCSNETKAKRKIIIENNNFNKVKIFKSRSSLYWQDNKKTNTNKENEKEEINQIQKQKEKKIQNNSNSIRKCDKVKNNDNIQKIFVNRKVNNINFITEYNNKNEEVKKIKVYDFKKRISQNIEEKLTENNEKIIKILNGNTSKLSRMASDFETSNNKRVHIRMFYKLKNSSLKNCLYS